MAYDPTVQSDYDPTMAAMPQQPTGPEDLARFGITEDLIRNNPNMQAAGITNLQQFWDRYQQGSAPNFGLAKDDPMGELVKYGILAAGTAGLMGGLPGTTSIFSGAAPASGWTSGYDLAGGGSLGGGAATAGATGGGGTFSGISDMFSTTPGAGGSFTFPGSDLLTGGTATGGAESFGTSTGAGMGGLADYAGGGFTPPGTSGGFTNFLTGLKNAFTPGGTTGGTGDLSSMFPSMTIPNIAGSLLNYYTGQKQAGQMQSAAERAAELSNSLLQPQRQPFQIAYQNLMLQPGGYQMTPFAQGQKNLIDQALQANLAKYGPSGTQYTDYAKNIQNLISSDFFNYANQLRGAGGYEFAPGGGNIYGQIAGQAATPAAKSIAGFGTLLGQNPLQSGQPATTSTSTASSEAPFSFANYYNPNLSSGTQFSAL